MPSSRIKKNIVPRQRFAPGKRRMTAEQFESVRPLLTRMTPERVEAARMALVEDLPLQSIADHYGWSSRQSVSDAVTSISGAWKRMLETTQPAGSVAAVQADDTVLHKRRMTAEQFDAVRPLLKRMSPQRVEAARLALVDDLPLQGIADHYGWSSRQNVSDAVTSVFQAWGRFEETRLLAASGGGNVPEGWETATLTAPPELLTKFRKEIALELGKIQAKAVDKDLQSKR